MFIHIYIYIYIYIIGYVDNDKIIEALGIVGNLTNYVYKIGPFLCLVLVFTSHFSLCLNLRRARGEDKL